ncbi:hypothetical protein COO55_32505 [Rhodococcus opacus]|nr:hypothetical protein COO55_32505 [Rhodococcus opacus]
MLGVTNLSGSDSGALLRRLAVRFVLPRFGFGVRREGDMTVQVIQSSGHNGWVVGETTRCPMCVTARTG